MIRRSTWITLALFAVALGVLWYMEWSPAKEARATPTPTSSPKLLNAIDPSSVIRLEVISSRGQNLSILRNPDRTWAFDNQPGKLVDQGQVEYLTSSLFGMNIKSELGDNVTLNTIGLDSATTTIKIVTSGGSQNYLHIGKINAVNNGYYVRLNDLKPVLVDSTSLGEAVDLFSMSSLVMATPTPIPSATPLILLTPQLEATPTLVTTKTP
jgi:hypothetical protein